VAEQYPDVVEKLMKMIVDARHDLGDTPAGVKGSNNRPLGWLYQAKTLTELPDYEN